MHNRQMMNEKTIEEQFEKSLSQAVGGHVIFPFAAKQQMGNMLDVIIKSNDIMFGKSGITSTQQSIASKAGFIAEEFHAETYNLDAILNDSNSRAMTDKYSAWKEQTWNGRNLKVNDTPDLVIVKDGEITTTSQSKYYSTAESTNQAMSEAKNGEVKYGDIDQLLGPEDQVNPQGGATSVQKHADAAGAGNTARGGDATQTEAYENTSKKVTSTLHDDEASSTPLTKQEAEDLASGDKTRLETIENQYKTRSTLRQMKSAAVGAAAMSAVISGATNSVKYMQLVRQGKMSTDDAVIAITRETICSAADSALKASANAGVQSLMVRYGGEKVVLATLAKQGMSSMLRTNAVTVGVVCAVDAIKDLVQLGTGSISKEQFYERQGKNLLNTSTGVMGGSLGAMAGTAVATSFGVGALATNALMIAGGLSGGLIAGLAMSLAIENHIEKPYQELVQNTKYMQDATQELERVSQNIFVGQIAFSKFLQESVELDRKLQAQMSRLAQSRCDVLDAIMKI